jgi:hypothetical protein
MSRKRYTPEQVIGTLREAEVAFVNGGVKTGHVAAQKCTTLAR